MDEKAKDWAVIFVLWLLLVSPILLLQIFVDDWVWYAIIIGFFAVPVVLFVWVMARFFRDLRR